MFNKSSTPSAATRVLAKSLWTAVGVLAVLPALALSPMPPPSRDLSVKPLVMPIPVTPPQWSPLSITSNFAQGTPIQLREASITVEVFGDQAQTRIDLRLFNPNGRVLEGELQFPLLDGQVVTGFALDVNGRMRDAVPVPKAKGQEIFEDIRRRRVDPGLLEATAGNQYKLRVYPIPARGERRVTITVTETLPRLKDESLLRVPLGFASTVDRLKVQVNAAGLAQSEVRLFQSPSGTDLEWTPAGLSLQLNRSAWTASEGPNGWLQLAIRKPAKPQTLVGESDGKRYFATQLAFKDERVRRAEPKHIALVWDASGSAAAQNRVLPVLAAYFRTLKKPVKLSLLVVRNCTEPIRTITVAPGGFDALAAILKAEPHDGSSNFDDLPIPADADATILVTDGLVTDGKRSIHYQHTAPVFAINGANSADLPRLRRLVERTGGALVDATLASADAAVAPMLWDGWRIVGLSSLTAEKLVAPSLRVQAHRISIAGQMLDTTSTVDITLAAPNGRKRKITAQIQSPADRGRWPAQQWATWRSAELADQPALHSGELARIAASHGIVGPNSSLIVLEQAADYARYSLSAPPELADEVARLSQYNLAQANQSRQNHLDALVQRFEDKQRWWDKDFPKTPPPKPPEPEPAQPVAVAVGGQVAREPVPVVAPNRQPTPMSSHAQPPKVVASPAPPPMPAPITPPAPAPAPAPAAIPPMALAQAAAGGTANRAATTAPAPSSIALQAWTPSAPYLTRLQKTPKEDLYRVYLDERGAQQNGSAFYMDVAGLFMERGLPELGLRILSNLAELNLENRQLLRLYAYRLVQARKPDLAVSVFERVAELAPNEPQSWRDLGLALADSGQRQRAVNALWEVVSRPWNSRFPDVGLIALAELNAIARQGVASSAPSDLDLSQIDKRLIRNLPLELRVVMAWDTDDTDVDLWVTDPNGERASYANTLTYQGGAMSRDATGGYGPEEFSLKKAAPGKYLVQAQFYGNRQQVLSAGTTIMVRITTGFGTPLAHDEWTSVRLTSGFELARIAEIDMK